MPEVVYYDWNELDVISFERIGEGKKILIMGDSTMQLGRTWDYLPSDWHIINVGKGSTTSVGANNRKHFINEQLPDYVVLGCGINDCLVGYDYNSFIIQYSSVLDEAATYNIPIICITIADPWGIAYPASFWRNVGIINMCNSRSGAYRVNPNAQPLNMDTTLIHYWPYFYETISNVVINKINEIEGI